jgi:hypothetical protein
MLYGKLYEFKDVNGKRMVQSNDPEVKAKIWKVFRMLQSLVYFPPEEVRFALVYFERDIDAGTFKSVFDHLKKYYIGDELCEPRYPIQKWNVHYALLNLDNRTTNFSENFHMRLNALSSHRPSFYAIVNTLLAISIDVNLVIEKYKAGKRVELEKGNRAKQLLCQERELMKRVARNDFQLKVVMLPEVADIDIVSTFSSTTINANDFELDVDNIILNEIREDELAEVADAEVADDDYQSEENLEEYQ